MSTKMIGFVHLPIDKEVRKNAAVFGKMASLSKKENFSYFFGCSTGIMPRVDLAKA